MPTSLSTAVLATNGTFLLLAFLVVILRLYIHRPTAQRNSCFGRDDLFIVMAFLFTLGVCLINILGVPVGHWDEPLPENISDGDGGMFLKFMFAWQFFYVLALTAIRLSCLYFYCRYFTTEPFLKRQKGLVWLSGTWALVFTITTAFQAWPIHCNWSKCPSTTDYPVMYVCMSITGILLDFVILALPLVVLHGHKMHSRKRAAIALIFSLGTFCIVASTVRLAYAVEFLIVYQRAQASFPVNFNEVAISLSMWSGIETGASTVCACLPCFGLFLSRMSLFRNLFLPSETKASWDGSVDRFTGTLSTSRRPKKQFSLGSNSPDIESTVFATSGKAVADEWARQWPESRDTLALPAFLLEAESNGKPTLRDHFEPEVEMGRIYLRTGSTSRDIELIRT